MGVCDPIELVLCCRTWALRFCWRSACASRACCDWFMGIFKMNVEFVGEVLELLSSVVRVCDDLVFVEEIVDTVFVRSLGVGGSRGSRGRKPSS